MNVRYLFVVSLLLFPIASTTALGQAVYRVDFDATWSESTHPGNYPNGAHFSPLIGATHDSSTVFWEPNGIATPGIELMAETGGTSIFRDEINAAAGTDQLLQGSGPDSPGSASIEFDANANASLLTLVTMIAPSPDWFVGVSGFDLRPNGTWIDSASIDLFAYDAGTDSGPGFTSPNEDTSPAETIVLQDIPLGDTPKMGTYTITLLSVPEPNAGFALGVAGMLLMITRRRR